jgi:hypothetical protein
MKPVIILDSIRDAGLTLSLLPGGQLKVFPADKITDGLRQVIRDHKEELIKVLSGDLITSNKESRAPCRDCKRLEVVNIMGVDVPGCLYDAPGEYSDGWKRLPIALHKCIFQ